MTADPKKLAQSDGSRYVTAISLAYISTFAAITAAAHLIKCLHISLVFWALYLLAVIFHLFIKNGEKRAVFQSPASLINVALFFDMTPKNNDSKSPKFNSPMLCIASADLGTLTTILPSSIGSSPVLSLLLASVLQGLYLCLAFCVAPLQLLAQARLVYSRSTCLLFCGLAAVTLTLASMFEIALQNRPIIIADKKSFVHSFPAVNNILSVLFRNDSGKIVAESPLLHAILAAMVCVVIVTICLTVMVQRSEGFVLFSATTLLYLETSRRRLSTHVERDFGTTASGKKNK